MLHIKCSAFSRHHRRNIIIFVCKDSVDAPAEWTYSSAGSGSMVAWIPSVLAELLGVTETLMHKRWRSDIADELAGFMREEQERRESEQRSFLERIQAKCKTRFGLDETEGD